MPFALSNIIKTVELQEYQKSHTERTKKLLFHICYRIHLTSSICLSGQEDGIHTISRDLEMQLVCGKFTLVRVDIS